MCFYWQHSDEEFDSDVSSDLPLDMSGSDGEEDIDSLFAPAEDFNEEDIAFSGLYYKGGSV